MVCNTVLPIQVFNDGLMIMNMHFEITSALKPSISVSFHLMQRNVRNQQRIKGSLM